MGGGGIRGGKWAPEGKKKEKLGGQKAGEEG